MPSATLTSEHGGGNEPPPLSRAGIQLLATNLDQQLAPLAVGHHQAADPTTGTVPVVQDLLDIPWTYSIPDTTSVLMYTLAVTAAAGPRNNPGIAVTAGNGTGLTSSVSSARTVPPAFSYIQSPEATSVAVPSNFQFAVHTPDVGSVGVVPNPRHATATVVKDNTSRGRG